uniref:Uncharacterized protein n=1 Tax=Arundo donax TaxID=35708 RepID=A0A0A9A0K3_ARUDO
MATNVVASGSWLVFRCIKFPQEQLR